MIPADLLDKLREKDPELWGKLQDQLKKLRAYQEGRVYEVDVIATFECLPQISGWILQGLLQDAIRARGWDFKIEKYHNSIWGMIRIPHECWTDEVFKCKADTEAAALLRAYLAALEATQAALREYLGREEDGQ